METRWRETGTGEATRRDVTGQNESGGEQESGQPKLLSLERDFIQKIAQGIPASSSATTTGQKKTPRCRVTYCLCEERDAMFHPRGKQTNDPHPRPRPKSSHQKRKSSKHPPFRFTPKGALLVVSNRNRNPNHTVCTCHNNQPSKVRPTEPCSSMPRT